MLSIRDVKIDNASLGQKKLLTDVQPAYEYKDGKRTDNITGYRYEVALVSDNLDKLNVRIEGKQLMDAPEDGFDHNLIIDRLTPCSTTWTSTH